MGHWVMDKPKSVDKPSRMEIPQTTALLPLGMCACTRVYTVYKTRTI